MSLAQQKAILCLFDLLAALGFSFKKHLLYLNDDNSDFFGLGYLVEIF